MVRSKARSMWGRPMRHDRSTAYLIRSTADAQTRNPRRVFKPIFETSINRSLSHDHCMRLLTFESLREPFVSEKQKSFWEDVRHHPYVLNPCEVIHHPIWLAIRCLETIRKITPKPSEIGRTEQRAVGLGAWYQRTEKQGSCDSIGVNKVERYSKSRRGIRVVCKSVLRVL